MFLRKKASPEDWLCQITAWLNKGFTYLLHICQHCIYMEVILDTSRSHFDPINFHSYFEKFLYRRKIKRFIHI